MNGIFGFAIYDVDKDEYFVARDHMNYSIIYWLGSTRNFYVASELKAYYVQLFPPWTLYDKWSLYNGKENGLIMML
jgi:asparagine synthase (glutamine-hydrolysing)